MSHMTKAETAIVNPNESILKETIEQIAKEDGLTVTTAIKDYQGQRHKVTLGLEGPGLRGIGFNIENGKLNVVGDPYGQNRTYEGIQNRVIQGYTVTATTRALTTLGYRPTSKVKQGEKIVMRLVAP